MQVIVEDGEVAEARGNTCRRGAVYAKQECIVPQRMVTAVVKAQNSKFPVSVKTQAPIPKKIANCKCKLDTPERRAGTAEAVGRSCVRDAFEHAVRNQAAKTASRKASNSSSGV